MQKYIDRFKERVKELSVIFKDRVERPLDTALFWTEYVLRHKGAPQLRSPARDLNFFQYHCLDVVAVLVLAILIIVYILYAITRRVLRIVVGLFKGNSKSAVSAQKKRK